MPLAPPLCRAGAVLTVDLGAIAANYRELAASVRPALCAAVVKADAYGLGVERVAPALAGADCRHFFVAHLDEGMQLRGILGAGAVIHVLHGPPPGTEAAFHAHDLVPVLNSPAQADGWTRLARGVGATLPAILQIDTGMGRLGLAEPDIAALPDISALDLRAVMTHLACADDPASPANTEQLASFRRLRTRWPGVPGSIAASSGIFLGRAFHCDMVRPGAALYGVAPSTERPPLRPVIRLEAEVIQTRQVGPGSGIGYGHTWRASAPTRIATIAIGYADGFLRSGSNQACAWVGDWRLPVVGRVSMDSVTLDASAAPPGGLEPGSLVEIIGPHRSVDRAAAECGAIAYEVLTGLGRRFERRYVGG